MIRTKQIKSNSEIELDSVLDKITDDFKKLAKMVLQKESKRLKGIDVKVHSPKNTYQVTMVIRHKRRRL